MALETQPLTTTVSNSTRTIVTVSNDPRTYGYVLVLTLVIPRVVQRSLLACSNPLMLFRPKPPPQDGEKSISWRDPAFLGALVERNRER